MNRFEDTSVVLTGAASGIGRATALRLVREGATVFAVDRDEAGLAETAEAAATAGPGRVLARAADLSDEQQVVDAAATALDRMDGVDVLVNVAGIIRATPLAGLDLDDYRLLFAVNLHAPVLMCRELAPHLTDGRGVVVNVTSTSATKAHPGLTGYAASKGALLAFTLSLAAELAPRRIRVVPVSPGGVATPLTANKETYAAIDTAWYARTYPLWGEPGSPDDLAAAIAFAASRDGAYLNGVELRVDGGSHV